MTLTISKEPLLFVQGIIGSILARSGCLRAEEENVSKPSPLAVAGLGARAGSAPRILLRSSWQTVNIGDIGHTPGLLQLLKQYCPAAQVTLWGCSLDRGVGDMLKRDFPGVRILEGQADEHGMPIEPEAREAWEQADFFLHGSGPYVVARRETEAWRRSGRGRPYGIYGVTLGTIDEPLRELLSNAAFVFCRDTVSLALARSRSVRSPVLEFAPDSAFGTHDRDDPRADVWLKKVGIAEDGYLCVIPRLRYTPYYKMQERAPTAEELRRAVVSAEFRERDHAKLREVIVTWVRKTGRPVIACPEMTYQVELARDELVAPLPDDVKSLVIWRDHYWRPDEAASVYARAAVVVSIEMHSPIIALSMGTPAIHVRQPTDSSKGQMWRDIGLSEWMFEIDDVDGAAIAAVALDILNDPSAARQRVSAALEFVKAAQARSIGTVAASCTPEGSSR